MSRPSLGDLGSTLKIWDYEQSAWSGPGITPFGTEVLHRETATLPSITDSVRSVADYMIELMRVRAGIGLAANQIGLPWRMFVHNLPRVAPQIIINPVIVDSAELTAHFEGCLSMTLDDTRAQVIRPKRIVVEGLTIDGAKLRIAADDLLARVFQHEIDHLDGLVYVQRLSGPERDRVYSIMETHDVPVNRLPLRAYRFRS